MKSYFCNIEKQQLNNYNQFKHDILKIPLCVFDINKSGNFFIQIPKIADSKLISALKKNIKYNNWVDVVNNEFIYTIFNNEIIKFDINSPDSNPAWKKMKKIRSEIKQYQSIDEMVYNSIYRKFLIKQVLSKEIEYLKKTIGINLSGIYPFGSIVLDYFDPKSSDYDILVVTKKEIDIDVANKLRRHFSNKKRPVNNIELCIATKKTIYEYHKNDTYWYKSSVCKFSKIKLSEDWIINRFILLKGNFSFYGDKISLLIKPISKKEVVQTAKNLLIENWSNYKNGADWMNKKKYQSFAILTMARILYTINYGDCVSKKSSAEWCINFYKETKSMLDWSIKHINDTSEGGQSKSIKMINFAISKL